MQALRTAFRAVSPARARRYDHKFKPPKFKPRFRPRRRRFAKPKR